MRKVAQLIKPMPCLYILMVFLVSSCDRHFRNFELNERSFDAESLQMVQASSHLMLSTNAHGLNFFYKAPIDPAFVAKVEIPTISREELLQQLSKMKAQDIHVSGELGPKFKWWLPQNGKILFDRQGTQRDETFLHAILTEEQNRIILYLEWST